MREIRSFCAFLMLAAPSMLLTGCGEHDDASPAVRNICSDIRTANWSALGDDALSEAGAGGALFADYLGEDFATDVLTVANYGSWYGTGTGQHEIDGSGWTQQQFREDATGALASSWHTCADHVANFPSDVGDTPLHQIIEGSAAAFTSSRSS